MSEVLCGAYCCNTAHIWKSGKKAAKYPRNQAEFLLYLVHPAINSAVWRKEENTISYVVDIQTTHVHPVQSI
jgi:hypothetical protein